MLLIFPFTMRESINYAIRARLRGEKIVGAASEQFRYAEYCDKCTVLPTIYDNDFEQQLKNLIETFGITRFYTPHEIVYQHVKSLNVQFEFAEGSPHEIMNEEYKAVEKTGLQPSVVLRCGHIYGHMSEEKLEGIEEISRICSGDVIEIGCAWGKSLAALDLLADGLVYAMDTWNANNSQQSSAPNIINRYSESIDWGLMEDICRANVPSVLYNQSPPESCSILHIDGNHDYECVSKDWDTYGKLLIKEGWLILDDIDWSDVAQLWREIEGRFDKTFIKGGAMFARKK